jgi:methionine-rich copper-binding protein CopC
MFGGRLRAGVLLLLTSVAVPFAVATGAAPAAAHNSLKSSTPADGEQLTTAPTEVTLTFMQSADPRFVKVAVRGPGGASATAGGPTVTGTVVHQPLGPLTSGKYTVEYRVVSQDGHPVSGALSFTLVLPEPSRAAASPAPSASPSTPVVARRRRATR